MTTKEMTAKLRELAESQETIPDTQLLLEAADMMEDMAGRLEAYRRYDGE